MKGKIDEKIQQYEDILATRYKSELDLDVSAAVQRDIRQVHKMKNIFYQYFWATIMT